jgi:hypothetical protein
MTETASGFQVLGTDATLNASGGSYVYIAIRRGPMKVPTLGTSVFSPSYTVSGSIPVTTTTDFPVDLAMTRATGSNSTFVGDRLRGGTVRLLTTSTDGEGAFSPGNEWSFDSNTQATQRNTIPPVVMWYFRRAPSYFDTVCYTGTGANRTVAHNLGVAPELIIVKARSFSGTNWPVYSNAIPNSRALFLNLLIGQANAADAWNSTSPTASVFTVGTAGSVNDSGSTFVAYLFATCPGVSKVGTYTGTGATQVINCGFTGGARFILIKTSDFSNGDWLVWDSARGIVSGNDPYLTLNTTSAQVTTTDWVDTASSGFELSNAGGNLANTNGVSYIFLAIA